MSYSKKIVSILAFLIMPFVLAQGSDVLPKPPVPLEKAGKYASAVNKVNDLLVAKDLRAFYKEVESVFHTINDDRMKNGEWEKSYRAADVAAEMWLFYYVALSPYIVENRVHMEDDLQLKAQIASRMKGLSGKMKAGPIGVEEKVFNETQCAYLAAIYKGFKDMKKVSEKKLEEVKKQVPKGQPFPYGRYRTPEERQLNLDRMVYENAITQTGVYLRGADGLVRKLVLVFPTDGLKVQKYLKQAGYSTDYECARLLQTTVGRSSETKYLFVGLPTEKEVTDRIVEERKSSYEKKMRLTDEQKAWLETNRRSKIYYRMKEKFPELINKIPSEMTEEEKRKKRFEEQKITKEVEQEEKAEFDKGREIEMNWIRSVQGKR